MIAEKRIQRTSQRETIRLQVYWSTNSILVIVISRKISRLIELVTIYEFKFILFHESFIDQSVADIV